MRGHRGPIIWTRVVLAFLLIATVLLCLWIILRAAINSAHATFLPTPGPFNASSGVERFAIICVPSTDRFSRVQINAEIDHSQQDAINSLDVFWKDSDRSTIDRSVEYANSTLYQNHHSLDYIWRGEWKRNPKISMMGRLWWEGRWLYSEIRLRYGAFYDGSRPMEAVCNQINTQEGKRPVTKTAESQLSFFKQLQLAATAPEVEASDLPVLKPAPSPTLHGKVTAPVLPFYKTAANQRLIDEEPPHGVNPDYYRDEK